MHVKILPAILEPITITADAIGWVFGKLIWWWAWYDVWEHWEEKDRRRNWWMTKKKKEIDDSEGSDFKHS